MSENKTKKTLTDAEITTDRTTGVAGRRGFMGLMAGGGLAAVTAALAPGMARAQTGATDRDTTNVECRADAGQNGRGEGGVQTGLVDGDSPGNGQSNRPGFGRGDCSL